MGFDVWLINCRGLLRFARGWRKIVGSLLNFSLLINRINLDSLSVKRGCEAFRTKCFEGWFFLGKFSQKCFRNLDSHTELNFEVLLTIIFQRWPFVNRVFIFLELEIVKIISIAQIIKFEEQNRLKKSWYNFWKLLFRNDIVLSNGTQLRPSP